MSVPRSVRVYELILGLAALGGVMVACSTPGAPAGTSSSGTSGGSAPSVEATGGASGNNTGAVTTNAEINPCLALSPAEAEAVFGGPAQDPPARSGTANTEFQCAYTSQDGGQRVSVLIRRAASADQNTTIFAEARNKAGPAAQPVSGLGDDAYYDPSVRQLNIKKGIYWVILSGRLAGSADLPGALGGIAPAVLARLP